MAIGHISIRVHTRSKGHSAAAGLAYRMGVDLVDSRTGVEHAYGWRATRGDVVSAGMVGCGVFADVASFAAAIEAAEKRKNSSILRDTQVALPYDLDEEQGAALLEEFARMIAMRFNTHVAWAMHRPDKRGDERNRHGHIVLPTREIDEDGQFGRKLRVLDDHKTGPVEVKELRLLWEGTANAHLEEAGIAARVDVGRRQDGAPMPTLGAACTAIEREEAANRSEAFEGKSVAALVTEGEPVTWRGQALQRHQQQAQREEEERAHRAEEPRDQADESLAHIPCAEVPLEDTARPARVDLRRAPSRPVSVSAVARPVAVAQPVRIELRREPPRRQSVTVAEVHVERAATPAPITLRRRMTAPVRAVTVREARPQPTARPAAVALRREPPAAARAVTVRQAEVKPAVRPASGVRRRPAARPQRSVAEHPVEVRAVAKPTQVVFARTVSSPSAPVDVRHARPVSAATPRRPVVRSGPVVAQPVRVRPVQVAPKAAPTQQDLAALETPPTLQELSHRLYEEVYAEQSAAAAVQPADPGHSMAIGYANWADVQDEVRHDDALCRDVAARTAAQAKDEQQQDYDVHHSWTERIAAWIRAHVDAALELLRLRQRQEDKIKRDRVRLAVRVLASRVPQAPPYPSNPSHRAVAVSDARLDRVAAVTKDEGKLIAEFQERHSHGADERTRAEAAHLSLAIERRHQEALAQYEEAEAERGVFSRRPPKPTRAEAEAAVQEEYETELLGVIEDIWGDIQQWSPAAVRSELQRLELGPVISSPSRPSPIRDTRGQEREDSGPRR